MRRGPDVVFGFSRRLLSLFAMGAAGAASAHAQAGAIAEPIVGEQRQVLHARVARVRAALAVQAEATVEHEGTAGRRVAQWYNWGDWPNGWNNYWNNWSNGWWNY